MKPTLIIDSECIFTGISENLIKKLKKRLTLKNPKYQDAIKYGRFLHVSVKPKLFFYSHSKNKFTFPRGFLNIALHLCQNTDGDPKIIDNRQLLPDLNIQFQGELRPYQQKAFNEIIKKVSGVLESGTGSGKTIIALAVIAHRKQPTLILVHTKELLYQWQERIKTFLNIDAGLMGDGHFDVKPISIAIINTAKNKLKSLLPHFGHIVCDESHRVPASMFMEVIKAFNSKYLFGLTATKYRRDGLTRLIQFSLGDLIHKIDIKELEDIGAVLKPEYIQKTTKFKFEYEDNYQAMITALTWDDDRIYQIIKDVSNEVISNNGIILVVSDRVIHCEIFTHLLREKNIKTALLTGQTKNRDRLKIIKSVKNGEISVLVSTIQLIGEGFDCPGLTTLFLTTPIKFFGRLLQVIGRILRPVEGKQPKVYDYVDPVGILMRSGQQRIKKYRGE